MGLWCDSPSSPSLPPAGPGRGYGGGQDLATLGPAFGGSALAWESGLSGVLQVCPGMVWVAGLELKWGWGGWSGSLRPPSLLFPLRAEKEEDSGPEEVAASPETPAGGPCP